MVQLNSKPFETRSAGRKNHPRMRSISGRLRMNRPTVCRQGDAMLTLKLLNDCLTNSFLCLTSGMQLDG
jgi:hypothetical protein